VEQRVLGRTGVRVSSLCLGAMMFGAWGNPDHDECVRIVRRALDAGITFIDTADVYSAGESEEIVGRAIAGRRDEVVLATKVHGPMGPGPNERGNSRLWIMREVEASLRRLGTDHIDLYQVHRPDPATDIEESLGALTDLVRQGKVRYLGCSTFPGWQIVEAQWAAERRGLERFVCEQPPYSIFVRHVETDVFPVAQRYGMGVIVWSPLAGGWLAGRYRLGQEPPEDSRLVRMRRANPRAAERFDLSRPGNRRKLELVEELAAVAEKAGLSLTHMALAFTLAHPAVTSAIIGPRTMEQLEDLLAGADVRLDDDTLDAIDALCPPGTVVEESDRGWDPPWMAREARRRPPPGRP
jgi:aryl-alcohol dehydrogenase-like predicted oxidoreductase